MPRKYQPAQLPDGSRNPKYRPRPRGHRGKMKNHFQYGQFCAWDGEGLTRRNRHEYVLLANSAGDAVWQDDGLSTLQIFRTICARARALDRRTTHVIFGGSYDVNCWLRDLSPSALARVWRGGWVGIADYQYRIQYRPRRSFVIHELTTGTRVTIWDVWGFFQGTFVGALEKYGLPVPERLRAMKKARHRFQATTARARRKIIAYCLEECALLVQLMNLVREYLETAALPIRRWDGAGACAAALLMRERTRRHQNIPPALVQRAAQHAYAGGRIEMLRYGHAPDVPLHHYDINSAYPTALRDVPALTVGEWRHTRETDWLALPRFALHRVRWNFTESTARAYPFFWRAPNGNIFYPPMGEGWYWSPEVESAHAALASGAIAGSFEVRESWAWHSDDPTRPFAFIDQLFAQRSEWKRAKIGAEKMIKLALNSLYGKCAQHVGSREGEPPRYHQLEWAGWITSVTRASLFRAIMEAGADAVMIATDGIFSTSVLGSLPVSPALGDWEYHCHTGATVVQSGVYWLDDTDETGAITSTDFSRGFDRGSLDRRKIVAAWKRRELTWDASLTRFVTMGAVVNHHARPEHWRQWRTTPRILALTPTGTKRTDLISRTHWKPRAGAHPAYGYIGTVPTVPAALFVGEALSTAYPLPWIGDTMLSETPQIAAIKFAEWEAMEE